VAEDAIALVERLATVGMPDQFANVALLREAGNTPQQREN
jgi:hypothetical protein